MIMRVVNGALGDSHLYRAVRILEETHFEL